MRVTLEFNLPEEQDEYEIYHNARKYYSVLWDLDQFLRNKLKYPEDGTSELSLDTLADIRSTLHDLLQEKNIEL